MKKKKIAPDTLFAANLPYTYSDDQLAELFEPFGLVLTSRIMRDRETGDSKGYGFVDLATDKAKAKAIEALHGKQIDGRKIEVRIAKPKAVAQPTRGARPAAGRMSLSAGPAAADAYSTPRPSQRAVLVEYRKLSAARLRTA